MSDSAVRKKISLRLKGDGEHKTSKENKAQTKTSHESHGPPEVKSCKVDSAGFPLHRGKSLNWSQPINFCAKTAKEPLVHICEQCQSPILIYGRMKKCRHAFCRDCTKKAGGKCPRCGEAGQEFDESTMGAVHVCTFGGGRYDNKGCGRSYLSKRDLDAHMAYRHNTMTTNQQPAPMVPAPPAFFPFPPGLPPPPLPPAPGIPPLQPQRLPPPPTDPSHILRPPPMSSSGARPPPPVMLPPNMQPSQWTPSSSGV